MQPSETRTKRRFAHELYPHPGEFETLPLVDAVPYLYARAVGFSVQGTSWQSVPTRQANDRIMLMIAAGREALIADALLQGKVGDDAWSWADERCTGDNLGEWVHQQAVKYGVDPDRIKPYECGPEPDAHWHYDAPDARGWRTAHPIKGRESECPACTEPVPS